MRARGSVRSWPAVLVILWLSAMVTIAVLPDSAPAARLAAGMQTWFGWGAVGLVALSMLQYGYFWTASGREQKFKLRHRSIRAV